MLPFIVLKILFVFWNFLNLSLSYTHVHTASPIDVTAIEQWAVHNTKRTNENEEKKRLKKIERDGMNKSLSHGIHKNCTHHWDRREKKIK